MHNIEAILRELYHEQMAVLRCMAQEIKIMATTIKDFTTAMNIYNDRQDKAITDLQADVQALNDLIHTFQTSAGTISAEDQASLDALQARASTVADKLDALDALTPPAAPVA